MFLKLLLHLSSSSKGENVNFSSVIGTQVFQPQNKPFGCQGSQELSKMNMGMGNVGLLAIISFLEFQLSPTLLQMCLYKMVPKAFRKNLKSHCTHITFQSTARSVLTEPILLILKFNASISPPLHLAFEKVNTLIIKFSLNNTVQFQYVFQEPQNNFFTNIWRSLIVPSIIKCKDLVMIFPCKVSQN